jgi:hypothetical protein
MKIRLFCLSFLFLLVACSGDKKENTHLLTISIEDASKDDMSFLEKIKIVPLETLDTALVKVPQSLQPIKSEKGKYLLFDSNQTVFLFDEAGKFVSSSQHCRGEGPKEYMTASDVLYNPYHDLIEIYDPNNGGSIIGYDENFNFQRKIKLGHKKGFTAQIVSALDSTLYALEPVRLKESDLYLTLFEHNENGDSRQVSVPCCEEGYVAPLNMMQKVFTQTDAALYYSPDYMDYHFYLFDVENRTFAPVCRLDVGDDVVTRKKLDAQYDEASFTDVLKNQEIINRKNTYLLSSDYMLPIIRLINDSYIYVHLISDRKPYDYVYDRSSGKGFLVTPDCPVSFYRCFAMQDNVLYTLLYPYELEKYITEEHRKYMTDDTWNLLQYIEEEDNPIVVEYHLKMMP